MSGPTIQFVIADINKSFQWTVHKQLIIEVVNYHWGGPPVDWHVYFTELKPMLMMEVMDYIKARDVYTRRYYAATSH